MTARSFLGAGDIYIDRLVDGVKQGRVGPIEANKLSIQPNVEKKESTSKGRYTYGQVNESVNLPQPAELKLELKEATGDILTMAFLGTSAAYSQAAGSLVDQAVVAKKGAWADIGKKNLATSIVVEGPGATRTGTYAADAGRTGNFTASAVTAANGTAPGVRTATFTSPTAYSVTDAAGNVVGTGATGTAFAAGGLGFTITAGSTAAVAGDKFTITVATSGSDVTLVEGTDYKLNRPLGLVMPLPASTAVFDGVTLKVTGAYGTATGTLVKGATRAEVRAEIIFDGINLADGSQVTATVWEAILSADSEFDFLADDFGVISLTGTVKTPVGKDAPFEVLVQDPV